MKQYQVCHATYVLQTEIRLINTRYASIWLCKELINRWELWVPYFFDKPMSWKLGVTTTIESNPTDQLVDAYYSPEEGFTCLIVSVN